MDERLGARGQRSVHDHQFCRAPVDVKVLQGPFARPSRRLYKSVELLPADALPLLACPRCGGGALETEGQGNDSDDVVCRACARRYPSLGGVQCLVEDPPLYRALWLSRLEDYVAVTGDRLRGMRAEAELPGLLPRTRARVERVVAAFEAQRELVEARLAPLRAGAVVLPPSRSEGAQAVLEHYENLFRDWAWGEAEVARARELVQRAWPGTAPPPRRLAVYGAGAARLAAEVHRALAAGHTFALDLNPLPLLVAAALLRGERLSAPELPVAPHADARVAVVQELRAEAAAPGFVPLLADALRPPLPPAGLDAVLTPWFVDAVQAELRETVAALGRALAPGGVWINIGPLRFNNAVSRVYTVEEALEIAAASGFQVLSHVEAELPYFDSPWSGSRRTDRVSCFAARKVAEPPPVAVPSVLPDWVLDPSRPIPRSAALESARRSAVLAGGVLSLVDGSRSIADLAGSLSQSWGVDPAALLDQLRAFFARMPPPG
jgi:hypothetical protein